jgi:hypothetical protein
VLRITIASEIERLFERDSDRNGPAWLNPDDEGEPQWREDERLESLSRN